MFLFWILIVFVPLNLKFLQLCQSFLKMSDLIKFKIVLGCSTVRNNFYNLTFNFLYLLIQSITQSLFLLLFVVFLDWFLSLFVHFNWHFREIVLLFLLLLSSSFFLDILILFPLLKISFWFNFPFFNILLVFFIWNRIKNWFSEGDKYFLLPIVKYFDGLVDWRVSKSIQRFFFLSKHALLGRILLNLLHHLRLVIPPFLFHLLNKTTAIGFLALHFLRSSIKMIHLIIVKIRLMTLFSLSVQLLFSVEWNVLLVLNKISEIFNSQIGQLFFNSFFDCHRLPPYLLL